MAVASTESATILLTSLEAARELRMSRRGLGNLVSKGELPCVRISSRCVRFRPEDLRAFAARKLSAAV